jgi:carboxymethylenebutenolidase
MSDMELDALLEAHRKAELDQRDVEATLATMTESPYIFFIATLTGGKDRETVREFYQTMLSQLPSDMEWLPLSRTLGRDQAVIESILSFTHDIRMDWILPGIPATGKCAQIPMAIVFSFKEGKLKSERVYWDLASTLAQLGVLDEPNLPISRAEAARALKAFVGRS